MTRSLERVVYWSGKEDPVTTPLAPEERHMLPVITPELVSSFGKPRIGGLWTSPEESSYPWETWCREEGMEKWLGDRYVLSVTGEPRILVVDSAADLFRTWQNYGRQRDWGDRNEYTDRDLNFECIAEDYDALWLTERGHIETRMAMELNTYAWDCETVLWFRWCFSLVERSEPEALHGAASWSLDKTLERLQGETP